jgi:hypothetical protein
VSIAADDQRRNAGERTLNGKPTLAVPPEVVKAACKRYMTGGNRYTARK